MNLQKARVLEVRNVAADLLRALSDAIDWEQREKSGRFRTGAELFARQQYLADKTYQTPMADHFQDDPQGRYIISLDGIISSAPGSR